MKTAIIYSSKTGNTQKIAEAIKNSIKNNCQIFSVEEAPEIDDFDLIFFGAWVDKGMPDAQALKFMKTITNKKVALFMTLGAYPNSDHAKTSIQKGINSFGDNCEIIDTFICQGAIDPKLIEWMKKLPTEHPHAPDAERRKRWKDASSRPNKRDCIAAAEFANECLKD
jgi:flavodoxin